MKDIYVGDLVINVGDRNVVGLVLPTSESDGGLHPATNIDVFGFGTGPRFSDTDLVPVRWNTDDVP